MTLVRRDEEGLFVRAGGYVARPGPVTGYAHALRMDDGGLAEGFRVKAYHEGGSPLTRITLPDGTRVRWHHEGPERDRGLCDVDPDAVFDENGLRVFSRGAPEGPEP